MQSPKLRTTFPHPGTLHHALLEVSPHRQHPAQPPGMGQQNHRGAILDEGPENRALLDVDRSDATFRARAVPRRRQENSVCIPLALGATEWHRPRRHGARSHCLRHSRLCEPGPSASHDYRGERSQGRQSLCQTRQANALHQRTSSIRGKSAYRRAEKSGSWS